MKRVTSRLVATCGVSVASLFASSFLSPASAQQAQGDPARGQSKIAMCIGCHNIPGYQASFPEVHKVPRIAGQNAKYIAAALTAYRKGERKHPTMRGVAGSLSDQDIADVAAYYEQLGRQGGNTAAQEGPAPTTEVAELLKKGNCAACHGANLNAPIDASYPKLAGQYADYLYVALKAYQTESNPNVGRSHAIMSAQAKPFNHQELRKLADYIGSLPSDLKTVPQSRFK